MNGERRYLVVGDGGRSDPGGLELDVPSNLRAPEGGADMIVIVPDGWESTVEPLVQHRRDGGRRGGRAIRTDGADDE